MGILKKKKKKKLLNNNDIIRILFFFVSETPRAQKPPHGYNNNNILKTTLKTLWVMSNLSARIPVPETNWREVGPRGVARRVAREKAVDNEQYITSKEDNYKGYYCGVEGNGVCLLWSEERNGRWRQKGTEGVNVRR